VTSRRILERLLARRRDLLLRYQDEVERAAAVEPRTARGGALRALRRAGRAALGRLIAHAVPTASAAAHDLRDHAPTSWNPCGMADA